MYDPEYLLERERFIQECRNYVENEDYKNNEWRDFCNGVIDCYEIVVDLYREFEDTYDIKCKKKAWKRYKEAVGGLYELLDKIKELQDTETVNGRGFE